MQSAADSGKAQPSGGSVLLRHVAAAAARRAAARGAEVVAPQPASPRTPERIVASALGRAGERVHGLPLFFDRVECTRAGLAELAELFPERALISVVEGPAEALGVVAICPGLLTSVIEMQAMGRISSRTAASRRPTRADGAICADFINACLGELGGDLALLPGWDGIRGYRYASFLDDPRPLGLMLDEVTFHLLIVRLRTGDAGQRDGCMVIALPAASLPAAPATAAVPLPVQSADGRDDAGGLLAEAVRAVPIDLTGVLCRRRIPLGELRALAPGDTIALPPGVLGRATIETAGGQVLFRGKLGELAGRHALRLEAGRDGKGLPQAGNARLAEGTATLPGLRAGGHEPPIADLTAPDAFRNLPQAEPGFFPVKEQAGSEEAVVPPVSGSAGDSGLPPIGYAAGTA